MPSGEKNVRREKRGTVRKEERRMEKEERW
jgi:hypothetical protein